MGNRKRQGPKRSPPRRRARYIYNALPQGRYTRIVTLDSGTGDDPLSGQLRTIALDEMENVEAISYVWGSTVNKKTVLVGDMRLAITQNLDYALRSLRLADAPRSLWADAICMNQKNLQERGQQVKLMGDIYRKAKRVLICVGPDTHDEAGEVKLLVRDIDLMIKRVLQNHTSTAMGSFPWPEHDDPLVNDERWASFRRLCHLEWFKRGWVMQEAGLAREAQIVWGKGNIDWLLIVQADLWFSARTSSLRQGLNVLHQLTIYKQRKSLARLWGRTPYEDALQILNTARHLSLYDKRDHLFAFIGLVQEYARHGLGVIEPDYSRSAQEIFLDFAKQHLQFTGDLRLIHFAHPKQERERESNSWHCYPSWVPRWHESPRKSWTFVSVHEGFRLRAEDGTWSQPRVRSDPKLKSELLVARGVVLGEFEYLYQHQPSSEQNSISHTLVEIWNHISHMGVISLAYDRDALFLAFISCCTATLTIWGNKYELQGRQAYLQHLARLGADLVVDATYRSEDDSSGMIKIAEAKIKAVFSGRQFAITKQGYLAMVPDHVCLDDVYCILFGSFSPVVLHGESGGTFRLLGDAIMPGRKLWSHADVPGLRFPYHFGTEDSKDWLEWGDVEEQEIVIC